MGDRMHYGRGHLLGDLQPRLRADPYSVGFELKGHPDQRFGVFGFLAAVGEHAARDVREQQIPYGQRI